MRLTKKKMSPKLNKMSAIIEIYIALSDPDWATGAKKRK